MADASVWTKGHPSGSSTLRDFDDLYRSDKSIFEDSILEEHYWKDGSAASAGEHKLGSARIYSGASSEVSASGQSGRLMWDHTNSQLVALHVATTTRLPSLAAAQTWAGTQTFSAAVTLSSTLSVAGATTLSGAVTLSSTLDVTGVSTLRANAILRGTDVTLDGGTRNSVDLVLRGYYDSDATIGVLSTKLDFSLRNAVTSASAYKLAVLNDAGSEVASISQAGAVAATSFAGAGSGLTSLNASNLASGTVPSARVSGAYGGITGVGTLTSLAVSGQITSSLATGTAPLAVTSTTVNANLNADLLDGSHASAFALASHTHAWGDVSKTGSSLADLATRSAADLSSGTLASARISGSYTGITAVGTLTSLAVTGVSTLTGDVVAGAIRRATSDGADNDSLNIAGGGAAASTRGSYIGLRGNEHATQPGMLYLAAGESGTVSVLGAATISSTLAVTGAITASASIIGAATSDLGAVTRFRDLYLSRNADIDGTLDVASVATFRAKVTLTSSSAADIALTSTATGGRTYSTQSRSDGRWQINDDTGAAMRIAIGADGQFLVGTTVTAGASAGDVVLPYGKGIRSVRSDALDTHTLLSEETVGALGNILRLGNSSGLNAIAIGPGVAHVGSATSGDLVFAISKGPRSVNNGVTGTIELISLNTSDQVVLGGGTQPVIAASLNLGGATVTDVLSATVVWDPPSISAGAGVTADVTVTGAAVGDPVVVANDFHVGTDTHLTIQASVISVDTVRLRLRNHSTGATDPGSQTVRVVVLKF
jgi:fibronectin-binding autotransporter adhesin